MSRIRVSFVFGFCAMWVDPWKDFRFPTGAISNSNAGVSLPKKTGWQDWTGWENWSGWEDMRQQPNDGGASWQKWDDAGASWQKRDTVGASWQTGGERSQWHERDLEWKQNAGAQDAGTSWLKHDVAGASWQACGERSQWHERDLEWEFNDRWQTCGAACASWPKQDAVVLTLIETGGERSQWRDHEWNVCAEWETQKDPSGPVGLEEPLVGASSAVGASLPAHVSGTRADGSRGTPGVWQTHGPQEGGSNCSEGPWKESNRRKKERKSWLMCKQGLKKLGDLAFHEPAVQI